jgi:hypothetical protein
VAAIMIAHPGHHRLLESFSRDEAPVVERASDDARSCATCLHFARWMLATGDCMLWAHRRQESLSSDAPPIPQRPARTTSDHETCSGWEPR